MLMLLNKLDTTSDHSFPPSLSSPGTRFPILLATPIYPLIGFLSPFTHLCPPIASPILPSSNALNQLLATYSISLGEPPKPIIFPLLPSSDLPTHPPPPTPSSLANPQSSSSLFSLSSLLVHSHLVPIHPTFPLPMASLLPSHQLSHQTHLHPCQEWTRRFLMRGKHKEEG
ncbi:hypothetical protein IHE45_10G033300 [Dioscorea alata]|uniref:Uncharacterized protein n=1 Tax=Dioscorea alata TaxID=55571 RepID=A0ACB7VA90_DIOAL|nr:hypothetical protein IHE45_10G033300 [Dioscorea alata]